MKTIFPTTLLFVLALASARFAQGPVGTAVCGPLDVRFDAQTAAGQPPAQPEPGKALVYVIEDFKKAPGESRNPTIRVGLDGAWIGAMRANSYIFFSVDPGEHHLCTSWQSHLKRLSSLASFSHVTAEAGNTYYFRARITYVSAGHDVASMDLNLESVDPDEGRFLVASNRMSNSHPQK